MSDFRITGGRNGLLFWLLATMGGMGTVPALASAQDMSSVGMPLSASVFPGARNDVPKRLPAPGTGARGESGDIVGIVKPGSTAMQRKRQAQRAIAPRIAATPQAPQGTPAWDAGSLYDSGRLYGGAQNYASSDHLWGARK
ncbi:hypothetical protein PTE30175_02130 [Pandoraea terrae]|uniref:Uncharacterized protein n=1 Tax=Pandoraea terrae TaxID=1537710 RepID=A0A5E4UQV2_9BURK|nr:hypothetical protein [Pandoraea terrae]VVE02358.1 hypothetical protein PTE30175_02130 [Pandoraea terrae]